MISPLISRFRWALASAAAAVNAATALVGLNQLWQAGLSTDQLADLGAELGADVPVFVRGNTAFAEGIGELLTAVDIAEQWYLVITPNVQGIYS